jgi:hypothetical protein
LHGAFNQVARGSLSWRKTRYRFRLEAFCRVARGSTKPVRGGSFLLRCASALPLPAAMQGSVSAGNEIVVDAVGVAGRVRSCGFHL